MSSIHRTSRTPGTPMTPQADGKEGVAGSSPAEGFIGTPRYGGDFCFPGRFRLRRSAALWVLSGSHRVPLRDPATTPSQIARWGFGGLADKASDVSAKTPFDDLEPSAVLKPKDIAARLDVDARSVRRAIARGELAASRTCGIRVLAGDAAAWWRAQLVVVSKPPRGGPLGPAAGAARAAPA